MIRPVHRPFNLGAVRDLRTLSKEERDALKMAVARRVAAGQGPKEICQALGLRRRTLAAWSKRGDIDASAHLQTPTPDQPRRPASKRTDDGSDAQAVLARVRGALQKGDRKGADQIVAGWASARRRDKALMTLEAETAREKQRAEAEGELSDDRLAAQVSDLIGRRVRPIASSSEKS